VSSVGHGARCFGGWGTRQPRWRCRPSARSPRLSVRSNSGSTSTRRPRSAGRTAPPPRPSLATTSPAGGSRRGARPEAFAPPRTGRPRPPPTISPDANGTWTSVTSRTPRSVSLYSRWRLTSTTGSTTSRVGAQRRINGSPMRSRPRFPVSTSTSRSERTGSANVWSFNITRASEDIGFQPAFQLPRASLTTWSGCAPDTTAQGGLRRHSSRALAGQVMYK
jgi:hypothetical protein